MPPVSYRICDENGQNWKTEECSDYTVVDGSTTAWRDGWYVVNSNVTIGNLVTVSGTVHLILADNASLTVNGGIKVAEGNSFSVYAQSVGKNVGTLTATGENGAGIGGGSWGNAGTITINGGSVTATGGYNQAGIGGGDQSSGGTVTISGGNVTATGGQEAAGIGSGFEGSGGNITIHGGSITATGGGPAAGIGSGSSGSYDNITINGGTVTATGGQEAAGIGSVANGSYGNITINGGTVKATGGDYAAGIGGGDGVSYGNITINGGNVTTTGGDYAAGIGSGQDSSGGNITIHGGSVTAIGGNLAAGIGGGFKGSGGNITINGGNVTATGADEGAGIGDGSGGSGGSFTTGTDGHALIFANGGISDTSNRDSWSGIIFEGDTGEVYKDQTLQENIEIPSGKTLTVPENTTLTVKDGVTLTNNGTITGNGTLDSEGNLVGSGTVAQTITNNLQKDSAVSVTVSPSPATYGSKVSITATISRATNAITLAAENQNQVEFFVGTDSNKTSLGTADVKGDTATLPDVEISQGKGFAFGENTITAAYSGSMGLKPQTDSTRLTVKGDLKDAIVTVKGNYLYTNSPIIPEVSVTWNGTQLTKDTDYTVDYTDNTNAGKATVTVTGTGNYTGTKTENFTIAPAQLNDATVNVNGTYTYTGQAQTPAAGDVVVTLGGKTVPSDQYTISASDNMNAGQATATVTAKADGNYIGSASGKFTIALASLNDAKVEVSGGPFTYEGTSKDPTVTVTLDSKTLSASTDYTLSYSNSNGGDGNLTNAGTVTVTATGKGNYTATATGTFTINKAQPNYTPPTGLTATYGDTLKDVPLTDGWAWNDLNTSVGNVGENTFPATYNKDSSGNYNPVQQNLTVKVSPASYKITLTGQADSPAQITLNEAVVEPGNTGAAVSYGYSTAADTDPSTWQTGRVFSGLTADTTYYFFAKVAATTNYAETISTGVAITTPEKEVSSISIKTQPAKLAYTSGQTLDLSGLSVQVSYSDNTSKTIGWDANKLTADPAQGTVLTVTGHSGKTVTISYGGKTAKTDALTVGKAEQAALSITGKPTTVYNGDTFTLTTTGGSGTGTVTWEIISGPATVDANGKVTVTGIGEIQIKAIKAADTEYAQSETTISLTAVKKPSSGGGSSSGGGGGGSSSSSKPSTSTGTTTRPDGTKVQTETKADGTKIQTTTNKDGSTVKTTTNPNGSSVTESKAADGSTGTVKIDKNGQTEAAAKVSGKAVEDAKKNGEAVKAPVEVEASRNSNTAPTVKVELPKGTGETKVEIPVSNVKPGTVAVLVHPDGTEEIVKNSIPTEDGIRLTVDGNATVKIVDNSKDFADTRDHWAKDAIDFVSARGLVNGMNDSTYAPNNSTTRAQLWTILARQNDANLNGGSIWYESAQNWAKAKGISDGANPNADINRAQMVTMLWRAVGQPAAGGTASFTDVSADSYYAQAVAWAIENGITTGVGGGKFDPTATCTRAQIATFLYRYMK